MKIFKSIAIASAISAIPANAQSKSDFEYEKSIDTITFGSCYNPRAKKHKIFDGILKHQPDVFIFVGDAIYGDTEDMGLLKRKWDALDAVEGFQKLRQSSKLLATWDDHDYGVNDGGKRYPMRAESSEIFLDFCGDSDDSPRRMRDGIYGSYVFGPDGKRCQILVLDTRYFRDDLTRLKGKKKKGTVGWYAPSQDESKTMLGAEQWAWLDQQFQVPADLRIIVSSTQILADEKGMENWGNLPHERDRLIALIKKHKAEHTIAISGDVHFTEISKIDADGYPLYDFTSSGMSHTHRGWANATNSHRIGKPSWEMNAGLIKIDWEKQSVHLKAIGVDGEELIGHKINFDELKLP